MQKRMRKILLIVCLALFLLTAPGLIFYSQGYRIDWGAKKITQTGGLFLKIFPKQVDIYLDSKFRKKTDFFFGSALIENLLPKKYKVLVQKEGFHNWEKVLEIKEKLVTTAENIVLFSQNPNFTILSKEVENFWFSPDGKKIVLKETGWSLKIYDLEREVKSHLIQKEDIHPEADLLDLMFFPEAKQISLEVSMKGQLKTYILETDRMPPTLTEKEEEPSLPENIITKKEFNGEIYYLDNLGHLFRTDKNFESKTKLTEISFPVLPETEYNLEKFSDFIFLQERNVFYLFNWNSKSFEKFFEPIKGFLLSPDSKKLVYYSDYEIWIFLLKDEQKQSLKRAGEKFFLIRLSEKIGEVFWLNSNYLVFTVGNKIKISEIDERDRINIVDFAEFSSSAKNYGGSAETFGEGRENPEIFFNQTYKKLYILSNGNLYSSEKLLP